MKPLYLNRAALRDKISACWLGKNIGGTMGGPFEGRTEVQNIQGFTSPAGRALPNDDLDLQLVWLKALESRGCHNITPQVLGEYWMSNIPPFWNEYGIGKANMQMGILPPLSGHYKNNWKDSNGAWIRSEIWACCTPGEPDKAIEFAFADACVDHGMGEGTYAELFTAAVESAAFVISDLEELIRIGLSKIPEDCRVARSIHVVLDAYHAGKTWQEARALVVEDNKDLGWFQAPGNLGFVVIGLLYGEGDFKKTMITAINCGDDTDCTGATVGALFGILYGTSVIPEDWKSYIGDEIITVALNRGCYWDVPKTCTELTDRTVRACEAMLLQERWPAVILTDGETDLSALAEHAFLSTDTAKRIWEHTPYSYNVDMIHTVATVEFDREPTLQPGETLSGRILFTNVMEEQRHLYLRWILPEGWHVTTGGREVLLPTRTLCTKDTAELTFTLSAEGNVEAANRLIVEVVAQGRPTVGLISMTVFS